MKVIKKSAFLPVGALLAALFLLSACGGGGGGSANGAAVGDGVAVAGTTSAESEDEKRRNRGPTTGSTTGAGTSTGSSGTTTGSGTASGGTTAPEVVTPTGNVDAATYRDTAQKIAQGAGILYRYGAPSTVAVSTTVPAANQQLLNVDPYWVRPPYWQVGGPVSPDEGDFSSNQGQYAFVPDDASKYAGIGTLEFLAQRRNTFSEIPQPSWTFPDQIALAPANSSDYYNAGTPAAMGRCYGFVCSQAVIAFANGTVGVFGSNTTWPHTSVQLDAGKVPTAVAVTNAGEFALVTVWDTVNLKGQVAVIALAGAELLHMDWASQYPGMPNMGAFAFMKLLGYVDLPGMSAPTEISATTSIDFESYHRLYLPTGSSPSACSGDFVLFNGMPLEVEVNRLSFAPGGCNYNAYAHGGVAVVVSKSENKAAFINLKPLFDYYQSMYFGTRANFDKTVNLGQAANQWPYPFSAVSSQVPTVIKTVDLGKRPTAVKVAIAGSDRAWIATEDGTLQFFSLGTYAGNGQSATPANIANVGSMAIGKNPTALAYSKHEEAGDLIVVSRGERKIQWVRFADNQNSGSISLTLQDSRLVDPVWAEDNDNHGTASSVLTIADYAGKRVSNYRFGPVIFYSNPGTSCQPPAGCGMVGGGPFEYGGSYNVPGQVFQVTGGNVP